MKYKDFLKSERVCGRHFVSGKPSQRWDKHHVDWPPSLNLGKKRYREKSSEAATERAERAKAGFDETSVKCATSGLGVPI